MQHSTISELILGRETVCTLTHDVDTDVEVLCPRYACEALQAAMISSNPQTPEDIFWALVLELLRANVSELSPAQMTECTRAAPDMVRELLSVHENAQKAMDTALGVSGETEYFADWRGET